jgi:hypothetical protein
MSALPAATRRPEVKGIYINVENITTVSGKLTAPGIGIYTKNWQPFEAFLRSLLQNLSGGERHRGQAGVSL